MEKRQQNQYLTDQQIQDLIDATEEVMVPAPDYLKQMILQKAESQFVKESVEIVPIRHTVRQKDTSPSGKARREKEFRSYVIKIVAAAAAIIVLVMAMPSESKLFMEREPRISMENKDSAVRQINQKTSAFCGSILEKTNQIFQKGE